MESLADSFSVDRSKQSVTIFGILSHFITEYFTAKLYFLFLDAARAIGRRKKYESTSIRRYPAFDIHFFDLLSRFDCHSHDFPPQRTREAGYNAHHRIESTVNRRQRELLIIDRIVDFSMSTKKNTFTIFV
jgi:hypothetical protein